MTKEKIKILILEDELAHAEAIKRSLKSAGCDYELIIAASLAEFDYVIAESTPSLVIADINLPDGNAFSLLKGDIENQPWPVLVMTSFGDEGVAVKAIKSGAIDYLVKSPEAFKNIEHVVNRNLREWHNIQKRKESEKKYRILFETMAQGVVYQDSEGHIISANMAAEKLLGLTINQLQNRTSYDPRWKTIHEDGSIFDGDEHPAMIALSTGLPVQDSVMGVFHPLENKYKWILVHAIPQFISDDPKPYQVFTTFTDITELKNTQDALKRSEEKLELALENGNIGVWSWNIKSNEIEWDGRMNRMLGFVNGKMKSSFEGFESFIVEEDLPHVKTAIKKSLDDNLPLETIFRIKPTNNDYSYISAKAVVKRDEAGKPSVMTGVCFDITDMKKSTENALFKLNEELLRSNKELGQFAYVASHDLQEPLRMVSSYTQLLYERYKDKLDEDAKEFIKFAVDGANRMYVLINDLLAYSRVQTKGKAFSPVDMKVVFEITLNNLKQSIQEKKAVVTRDELPVINADGSQMVQLLQNLIGNAIKFSNDLPEVHVSAFERDDSFVFSVKDNGIGIEPQYFDRIFQIFQRLHRKEQYGGTGIGLAICKRIVERHGGRIWIESECGKGSTFYFSIIK
jgi:PAS domain S-box-containing protein